MADAPTELSVTMLLCDAAQAVGGKLFVLGAGWTQILVPDVPTPMAIALRVLVPWDQSNQPFDVRLHLITDEGEAVDLGQGPIEAKTRMEVGRPPGLRKGTPLVAILAVTAGPLSLPAGRYVWELEIGGIELAREVFEVMSQPQWEGDEHA